MRITTRSLTDFIANLSEAEVAWRTVHVDRTWQRDEVRNYATFQASAVLSLPGGGEALLQLGQDCGYDIVTSDGTTEASDLMAVLYDKLKGFCDANGLSLKPGYIDMG